MALSTAQKLKIKAGETILCLNAPADFKQKLSPLPENVLVTGDKRKKYHQIHWFVLNKAAFDKELENVLNLVNQQIVCWIYYPKGSSKLQTDLTRDKGWDNLLKHENTLTWLSLISFDETWSAFGCRRKNADDTINQATPKQREIEQYINATTKTITPPQDLLDLLNKNKSAATFFNTLSFTNKKEYVEWIVTAKKAETRYERLNETIKRLQLQWKNPRNI